MPRTLEGKKMTREEDTMQKKIYRRAMILSIAVIVSILVFTWWSWTSWRWGLLVEAVVLALCYQEGKRIG
jgi:uncharacterized membrane protein YdbT with pleckstrin-like domain